MQQFSLEKSRSVAITPSDDTAQFPVDTGFPQTREIIVGTAGTIHYISAGGDEVTVTFPAGRFDIALVWVKATGTTATGISGHA